jgi:type I restriction enzyme S subunit
MSEVARVPQLRFPEFSNEWEKNKLGNLAVIKSGISPSKYELKTTGSLPFLKVEDLNNCRKYQFNSRVYSESLKNSINKNSVIFPKRGAAIRLNKVRINKVAALMDSNLMALLPNTELLNTEFLYYKIMLDGLYKIADTSTIPQINNKHILPYKLNLPILPEQQKIAAFLTAVDSKIEQLSKKQELLGEYKKGLMQQIFSQAIRFRAGDTPGQPLLPNGNSPSGSDFPNWEEKRLGDLCEITTGKLDANAMVEGGQYRFYTCAKEYYKIDDYAFDTDALIVSGNGANVGYIHHYQGKFNAYQRTYVLDSFTDNIIFVKFVLDEYLHKRIMKEKNEGNTPYIVMGTLTDMKINLPSFSEQTKIAIFLSSIDSKIEQVGKQLDESKQFKKALLQQMFV